MSTKLGLLSSRHGAGACRQVVHAVLAAWQDVLSAADMVGVKGLLCRKLSTRSCERLCLSCHGHGCLNVHLMITGCNRSICVVWAAATFFLLRAVSSVVRCQLLHALSVIVQAAALWLLQVSAGVLFLPHSPTVTLQVYRR